MTEDWPLHDYLWRGHLPQNPEEADRILNLSTHYRAQGSELEIHLPPRGPLPARWVTVPPKLARPQLLADLHDSLMHCGRDKLWEVARHHYWWSGMHQDAAECVARCTVCQNAKPHPPPKEVPKFIDKGLAPF